MEILYTKYAICLYFSDVRTEQKHNTTVGECCDEGNHDVHWHSYLQYGEVRLYILSSNKLDDYASPKHLTKYTCNLTRQKWYRYSEVVQLQFNI